MTGTDAGERPDQPRPTDEPSGDAARRAGAERSGDAPAGPAAVGGPPTDRAGSDAGDGGSSGGDGGAGGTKPRRRGSRGGRNRARPRPDGDAGGEAAPETTPSAGTGGGARPRIGDTRPAPPVAAGDGGDRPSGGRRGAGGSGGGGSSPGGGRGDASSSGDGSSSGDAGSSRRRRRRGGRGRGGSGQGQGQGQGQGGRSGGAGGQGQRKRSGGGRSASPVTAITDDGPVDLDDETLQQRRGRERKGRPVGRYLMAVHVQPDATQIAVLEGRSLIEHYVSRPADAVSQIHGNIYLGKVQNVLPGMEAAFVDIGTPKNAVLYRSDTRHDPDDLDRKNGDLRIEQILKARQTILCQVTKNPIGAKGARLTQEVSLPGRFVVLVPNASTYGISKRLPDNERKRLRAILDGVKPEGHGLIVRTAAEGISAEELQRDVARLAAQWDQIEALAARSQAPALLYQEPDMAVRVIREEFNQDYRQVVIDDDALYEEVRDYVNSISPALKERVERYDPARHGDLPIYETHRVHEQLHKALDRKVWLPSGGSLIIERTEALTVIDVNTGKNVGTSNLEETVFRNNLEAAEEVARQLRLRDIGGIIVIDFIDMEIKANREKVIGTFRSALARDKTRTQVFDISELGLVEMTRKRIGEGLIESLSTGCPTCEGRGLVFDKALIGE